MDRAVSPKIQINNYSNKGELFVCDVGMYIWDKSTYSWRSCISVERLVVCEQETGHVHLAVSDRNEAITSCFTIMVCGTETPWVNTNRRAGSRWSCSGNVIYRTFLRSSRSRWDHPPVYGRFLMVWWCWWWLQRPGEKYNPREQETLWCKRLQQRGGRSFYVIGGRVSRFPRQVNVSLSPLYCRLVDILTYCGCWFMKNYVFEVTFSSFQCCSYLRCFMCVFKQL